MRSETPGYLDSFIKILVIFTHLFLHVFAGCVVALSDSLVIFPKLFSQCIINFTFDQDDKKYSTAFSANFTVSRFLYLFCAGSFVTK